MNTEILVYLMGGALLTLEVTLLTIPVVLAVALIVGLARLSPIRLVRLLATIYVETFRGTSAIVQLYLFFFVLPPLLGIRWAPIETAVVALGLNFGAYASEIVRSSILTIDRGQREAALALNMTPTLAMRRIILPQALWIMLPPFGNYAVQLFKATSLTSLVQIEELTFRGYIAIHMTFDTVEILSVVAAIYFVMIFPASMGIRLLERRLSRGFNRVGARP
jgi:polar amino acid transport system permease protein